MIPALLVPLLFMAVAFGLDDAQNKINELEAKLKAKPGEFDWGLHNELRHLYAGKDEKKSYQHIDIILRNAPMDGYMLGILGGDDKDKPKAVRNLLAKADKYPEFTFIRAACWLKAAELEGEAKSKALLQKVADLKGDGLDRYRALAASRLAGLNRKETKAPWTVKVLVLNYFPVTADKKNIDIKVTSNVGAPLAEIKKKCERMTKETLHALQEGSRYHAYKNPDAKPSLLYEVVDTLTYYEAVPPHPKKKNYNDYNKMMERSDIRKYVEEKGVREVWIWGYHSPTSGPVESNMASVHGNISNSHRDPFDLPILKHTYTVYHYNYERETAEAVHDHMHQLEAIYGHYGGELWKTFTGKPGQWRCGCCHFPVNAVQDYDYHNKRYVDSDIEDWRPEGFGEKKRMNCDRWNSDEVKWHILWMQSIPGANNGLTYQGKPLTNWWVYVGDYDNAVFRKTKLVD